MSRDATDATVTHVIRSSEQHMGRLALGWVKASGFGEFQLVSATAVRVTLSIPPDSKLKFIEELRAALDEWEKAGDERPPR